MPRSDATDDRYLFRSLMDETDDSVYFKDRQCRFLRISRKMAARLGYADPAAVIGKTDADLFGEAFGQRTRLDDTRIMDTDEPLIGVVESRQMEGGVTNWTLTTKLPLHDDAGTVIGLMGITREINELKKAEMDLQHLATHDPLTDLPNRYLMVDRLNQVIARSGRFGTTFGVLFMDLNGFKAVNDVYGHDGGDVLLKEVAHRLASCVRASDTVARIGGDEFVIVLDTLHSKADTSRVVRQIEQELGRPFVVQGNRVTISISVGASFYPLDGLEAEGLLKAADYAMYLAKNAGRTSRAPRRVRSAAGGASALTSAGSASGSSASPSPMTALSGSTAPRLRPGRPSAPPLDESGRR